ncbi:polysaccharide pyruvyl transferase family protein [Kaistella daneshvariae]|uniref:Polysaccharide pyruvyl transferase family protein n=1 Tax=Kaistella daneshvariae TaxID=2487074 RepID=A0ABM7C6P2_9FLAO|nr:polysaccharide pyruvyl transferase family protein [Kaistella daneshvariae]AZI66630.1 polysaccharide pyruvyl transferase family protein [Kaistella daneshvariae]
MGRKKILVDIYLAKNLGDDLFLDHLSHSFPNSDFVPFHPGGDYKVFFDNYKNIQQFPYSVIDRVAARLGNNKLKDYDWLSKSYDGLLFLGGGIFREEFYWKEVYNYRFMISKAFKSQGKNVFFSGCNFGPYESRDFVKAHHVLFQEVDHVQFRDQKSYKLFSSLNNIGYAPDLLWSYDLPTTIKTDNILGISIIDPRHKPQYKETYQEYIESHKELCEKYLQNGFEIKLFSFCEAEGDLEIAEEIAKDFPGIKILNYTTEITNYLKEIGSCSHFVAARFHAVIIAFKYGIPVIPVIYGDKTENLLIDLGLAKPYVYLDAMQAVLEAKFSTISVPQKKQLYSESKKHFDIEF